MNPYIKSLLRKSIILCGSIFSFLLLVEYIAIGLYFRNHFYEDTWINGVDCSHLTAKEASQKIEKVTASYCLTIYGRNGYVKTLSGESIGLRYESTNKTRQLLKSQKAFRWLARAHGEHKIDDSSELVYDNKLLQEWIARLSCLQESDMIHCKDAYISSYDAATGFTIVKENQGTELDPSLVKQAIEKAIQTMTTELSLEKAGYYKKPTVVSTSPEITRAMESIEVYMKTSLQYQFGDKTEVLDRHVIGPAIKVDSNFQVTLNEQKIKEFITYLADTYNTQNGTFQFNSSYGRVVTVKGGANGWILDEEQEHNEVLECIKEGRQGKREPIAAKESMSSHYQTIGNTYVEICKGTQHMFFYKNGVLVLESDIVTGILKGGHDTPNGLYYISQKQRDRVLRGFNDDGSRYSAFVNYWMRFNGGIGLHDATWQSSFGGKRYLYAGSHGCVNLPWKTAKSLYNAIDLYTPVIVYN